MSFLTPLFLLGSLAIAGPIIFHLIRRTTKERTLFSSLMFLSPTPPRLTRRSRIEHWLLLALRCGILGLMAMAFARPFLKNPPGDLGTDGKRKRIVVLVDTSASMRRGSFWDEARQQATAVAREAAPEDELAVMTFAQSSELLVSFDDWKRAPSADRPALVTGRLADRQPSWLGTHLGAALIRASDLLAETSAKEAPGIRRVVLISDLQMGSHLEALQSYEWPKDMELVVMPVVSKKVGNASLQWLPDSGEIDSTATNQVRVRVSNTGDATRERLQVGWAAPDGAGFAAGISPMEIYVPAGQNRTIHVVVPTNAMEFSRIFLAGDDQPFDNLTYVVAPEPIRSSIIYWGSESLQDLRQPAAFLRESLPDTRRQAVAMIARPTGQAITTSELDAAVLYVITDSIPESTAAEIRQRVTAGKMALVAPRRTAAATTVAQLLGVESVALTEAKVRDYAMFGTIDFRHPCFAPFADPRYSDFTKIHFWKYRRVAVDAISGARLVASFDSGDPALLEIPSGRGRILLLTSGWHPEDSQFALSSKFVPFIYSILEMAGAAVTTTGQTIIGESAPIPPGFGGGEEVKLTGPSGPSVSLGTLVTNLPVVEVPGIYSLQAGKARYRFTANMDPLESRTQPLSIDDLEKWGAPIRYPAAAVSVATQAKVKEELQSLEAEGRQKMWRWFVAGTLAVLLGETMVAGWTTRRAAAVT